MFAPTFTNYPFFDPSGLYISRFICLYHSTPLLQKIWSQPYQQLTTTLIRALIESLKCKNTLYQLRDRNWTVRFKYWQIENRRTMKKETEREKERENDLSFGLVEDRLSGISGTENVTTETRLWTKTNERRSHVRVVVQDANNNKREKIKGPTKELADPETSGTGSTAGSTTAANVSRRKHALLSLFCSLSLALSSCTLLPVARLCGTASFLTLSYLCTCVRSYLALCWYFVDLGFTKSVSWC